MNVTPVLCRAAKDGDLGALKLLIGERGTDYVNLEVDEFARTPLMHAILAGQLPIVKELLACGAKLGPKNDDGGTALMYACYYGSVPILRLLLGAPSLLPNSTAADVINEQNKIGSTALHYAVHPHSSVAKEAARECIRILVANGADASIRNRKKKTPAEHAKNKAMAAALQQAIEDKESGALQSLVIAPSPTLPHTDTHSFPAASSNGPTVASGATKAGEPQWAPAFSTEPLHTDHISTLHLQNLFETSHATSQAKIGALQQQLDQERLASRQMQQQLTSTQQQLYSSQQHLSATHEYLTSTQTQLDFCRQEHQESTAALMNECALLRRSLQQIEHEKSFLAQRVIKLELENATLRNNGALAGMADKSSASSDSDKSFFLPQFTVGSLAAATDSFADGCKLGHGRFSATYKALLLGNTVAVKRVLSRGHKLVESSSFESTVRQLSRLHHLHVGLVLGFADEGNDRYLVREYFPSGSLADWLKLGSARTLGSSRAQEALSWKHRASICKGIAEGMSYLQGALPNSTPVFHLALKSSNVFLDESLSAKIADFGLARPHGGDADTMASTCPEYRDFGTVSCRTDVYGFGCIVLELLTGAPASPQQRSLARRELSREKTLALALDGAVEWTSETTREADALALLALQCVEESRLYRPYFRQICEQLAGGLGGVADDAAAVSRKPDVEDAARECNVCFSRELSSRLLPCRHVPVCAPCAEDLLGRGCGCVVCHAQIESVVQVAGGVSVL